MAVASLTDPNPTRTGERDHALRALDRPRAVEPGPTPYRVLVVGGRLLAGHGVHTHSLALTGTIARSLARRVDCGIDLRSVLSPDTEAETIGRALRYAHLEELDAIVLVPESPASRSQGEASLPRTVRLLERLSNRLTPGGAITLAMSPPGEGMSARDVQEHLAALRQHASALTRIQRLVRRPPAESAAARFAAWGDAIAETVASSLIEPLAAFPYQQRTAGPPPGSVLSGFVDVHV